MKKTTNTIQAYHKDNKYETHQMKSTNFLNMNYKKTFNNKISSFR